MLIRPLASSSNFFASFKKRRFNFQSGFESLKEELGPSRESTLPRQQVSVSSNFVFFATDIESKLERLSTASLKALSKNLTARL
jgi:hypothetical protein